MTMRLDYVHVAPDGMMALGQVYGYILKSGLPTPLVNLVYLRCSQINGCTYCIDLHSKDLAKEGVSCQKMLLASAWREAKGVFTEKEQAALAWAEALTRLPETAAPDADFQAMKAQFSEKEIADLTIAIGLINVYNRVAVGFRRGPEGIG
ncbi:carboxymuconolactone decarboxylase family protein [Caulobacter sp. 17J80-11]|uniref:carboxymuconolactone decarboxylase family protein n=1 Tax=Caulobacter sp. 17J80-11 TaxID=2763502 RepID=UPI00165346A7|nr:carboxymuconolactone decarboxylase family protein [Caulobacter sp. 17J80-11]MBC6982643.1 carboxymuconolactone decarboxylase family protein [Caulobacter sp. 17J80-11]